MRRFSMLALAAAAASVVAGSISFASSAREVKTFRLSPEVTAQDFQDIATAALMMSDLVTARSSDAARREFTLSGTADQIEAAEWVITELDRPASATPLPPSAFYTLKTKQPANRPAENTMRVFYPGQISSAQDLMEVSTAIRTISDIRRVSMYTSHRAIVVTGTREEVEFVEWISAELNRDVPGEAHLFPKEDSRKENSVRIVRFSRAKDLQSFNETQTMIRTLTDMRRVYPHVSRRTILMRGTEEQVDLAKWLVTQVDKELPAAQGSVSAEYATKDGQVVKMFYFNGGTALQTFNETQTSIRTNVGIRQVYPHASYRTLAARGTPAQIAQISTLLPK